MTTYSERRQTAYGSFISSGLKTVLLGKAIIWEKAVVPPLNLNFSPGTSTVEIFENGIYHIIYSVNPMIGREAQMFLNVDNVPQSVTELVLPLKNGRVGGNVLLPLEQGSLLELKTSGAPVTLSAGTNAFLVLTRVADISM